MLISFILILAYLYKNSSAANIHILIHITDICGNKAILDYDNYGKCSVSPPSLTAEIEFPLYSSFQVSSPCPLFILCLVS